VGTVTDLDACAVQVVDAVKVSGARRALPGDPELGKLTDLFRLLGDPTRARILYALLAAEELCVCDIAATTHTAETTTSHALRLLRTAGVVSAQRVGRMMYYRLADGHVRMLLELTREHIREDGGR
jgi:DNA-binding transcriptional ArsR family regulator